jgi:hypothetical protein
MEDRKKSGVGGYIDRAIPTSGKVTLSGKLAGLKGCDIAGLKGCELANMRGGAWPGAAAGWLARGGGGLAGPGAYGAGLHNLLALKCLCTTH